MKTGSRFRSNRFFLVSLAKHDDLFLPKKRFDDVGRKIGLFCFLAPIVLILLYPSKDIGRLVSKAPELAVPDSIVAGDAFSWKGTAEIASVLLNGRPLLRLSDPELMYFGTATSSPSHMSTFDIVYSDEELSIKQKLKRFFTLKTEHPEVPYFSKALKVENLRLSNNDEDGDDARRPASQVEVRGIEPDLRSIFENTEGEPKLACWKTPEMKFQEPPPTLPGRKPIKRRPTYTVTSAGPGEVVFAGDGLPQEKVLVIHHGGGVFTRYLNLKDFRVRKGQKVKPGQELGSMVFASQKEASHAEPQWEVRWGTTSVTPPSFLALSSQLCGST